MKNTYEIVLQSVYSLLAIDAVILAQSIAKKEQNTKQHHFKKLALLWAKDLYFVGDDFSELHEAYKAIQLNKVYADEISSFLNSQSFDEILDVLKLYFQNRALICQDFQNSGRQVIELSHALGDDVYDVMEAAS